jgi:hypothetical protein
VLAVGSVARRIAAAPKGSCTRGKRVAGFGTLSFDELKRADGRRFRVLGSLVFDLSRAFGRDVDFA